MKTIKLFQLNGRCVNGRGLYYKLLKMERESMYNEVITVLSSIMIRALIYNSTIQYLKILKTPEK